MNFAAAVWCQDVTGFNRVKLLNLPPCAGLILRQGHLNGSAAENRRPKTKKKSIEAFVIYIYDPLKKC